jgi:Bacterial lectin
MKRDKQFQPLCLPRRLPSHNQGKFMTNRSWKVFSTRYFSCFLTVAFACSALICGAAQTGRASRAGKNAADNFAPNDKSLTTIFAYANFSDLTGLTLNGNAEQAGLSLLVGPPLIDQVGSVFYNNRVNVGQGFQSVFTLQIVPSDTSFTTADGMSFIIQNSSLNALGTQTGQPGYYGIPDSIAVEFDTFYNPQISDPNNNHIGIQSCGTLPNTYDHASSCDLGLQPDLPVTLADGLTHQVMVSYIPDASGAGPFTVVVDKTVVLTRMLNLSRLLALNGNDAWVGFTAGSGDDWESGTVRNWTFASVGTAAAK